MFLAFMSNIELNVVAMGQVSLRCAMAIAFEHNCPGKMAEAWVFIPEKGFVLLWNKDELSKEDDYEIGGVFPTKLDLDGTVDMTMRWLKSADYGHQPGHDGSNEKGFQLYCEDWGYIEPFRYAICAVKPKWTEYGK